MDGWMHRQNVWDRDFNILIFLPWRLKESSKYIFKILLQIDCFFHRGPDWICTLGALETSLFADSAIEIAIAIETALHQPKHWNQTKTKQPPNKKKVMEIIKIYERSTFHNNYILSEYEIETNDIRRLWWISISMESIEMWDDGTWNCTSRSSMPKWLIII